MCKFDRVSRLVLVDRACRPDHFSRLEAGVVASGTASSAAVMARREKDSSCMVGALAVRMVSRGSSTASVLAIVHFGSVGRLCGLFERSKAT
jgi:hypothetical protein